MRTTAPSFPALSETHAELGQIQAGLRARLDALLAEENAQNELEKKKLQAGIIMRVCLRKASEHAETPKSASSTEQELLVTRKYLTALSQELHAPIVEIRPEELSLFLRYAESRRKGIPLPDKLHFPIKLETSSASTLQKLRITSSSFLNLFAVEPPLKTPEDLFALLLSSRNFFKETEEGYVPLSGRELSRARDLRTKYTIDMGSTQLGSFLLYESLIHEAETHYKSFGECNAAQAKLSPDSCHARKRCEDQLAYLERVHSTAKNSSLCTEKVRFPLPVFGIEDSLVYALLLKNPEEPDAQIIIQRNDDGTYSTPIKKTLGSAFKMITLKSSFVPDSYSVCESLKLNDPGALFLADGTRLLGKKEHALKQLFASVRAGEEIYDPNDSSSSAHHTPLGPRHWGQKFLASLSSEPPQAGRFFDDETPAQVYFIDNAVVIEPDTTKNATYVFTREGFREFSRKKSTCSRLQVREGVNGYIGRIRHSGEEPRFQRSWEQAVREKLARCGSFIPPASSPTRPSTHAKPSANGTHPSPPSMDLNARIEQICEILNQIKIEDLYPGIMTMVLLKIHENAEGGGVSEGTLIEELTPLLPEGFAAAIPSQLKILSNLNAFDYQYRPKLMLRDSTQIAQVHLSIAVALAQQDSSFSPF